MQTVQLDPIYALEQEETPRPDTIDVYCTPQGACLVYSAEDALTLRTHYRVCGAQIGSLSRHSMQNQVKYRIRLTSMRTLPLLLLLCACVCGQRTCIHTVCVLHLSLSATGAIIALYSHA